MGYKDKKKLKAKLKEYRDNPDNKEKIKEYQKQYRMKMDPTLKKEYDKQYNDKAEVIDKKKRHSLSKFYGLTLEQYNDLLIKQNGVCAICRQLCKTGKRLSVDHCHTTGKIRGLLCSSCNLAVGNMYDDPLKLRAAADYLERN